MDKEMTWWEAHRPSKRRLIQLYSALLYNAHLRGFIDGEIYQGQTKAVCVPGFNCYSCPGAVGACPLGSIQNALASSGHRAGWYVLGIIMIFGLTLGRTICGWLCPVGLMQELLYRIPTPKIRKNRVTRALTYLKYVIIAIFVVSIPLYYGFKYDMHVPGFCKFICPAGTFEGAVGLLSNPKNASLFSMLKILFTRKFVIMMIVALACIFCYRSFCRFLCPLGAIYGMFNKLALISVKVDEDRCNGCGACVRTCKMDVRHVGDHECINCAGCMRVCAKGALSLKAGTHTILAPSQGCADDTADSAEKRQKNGRIGWGVAIAVLCFALVWFNFLDPSVKKRSEAQAAAAAQEEAPEETALGENSEEGAQADTAQTGTAQAGTAQCVAELPIFDKFYREHKEDAIVLAVHASDVLADIPEFLEPRGLEMPFCIDDENDTIFGLSGASTSLLPQTVILDRNGTIIYNQTGSMTEELLNELYDRAK